MSRALALRAPHPGALVALALAGLAALAFGALIAAAQDRPSVLALDAYLRRILVFSLAQAALSTALSLGLGAALALALARRRFPGRELALAALGAAAVMPAIVVVFSVVAVYGRSGWLAAAAAAIGLEARPDPFGWPGILLAHVFLNAALAARVFLDALARAPAEHWRLAAILGFGPRATFAHLDWPILKRETPGLAGLVFLLCFTSFAIVLTLGGGPGKATLEVAIFSALRVELDFARAAMLAGLQLAVCLSLTLALHWAVTRAPVAPTERLPVARPDAADPRLRRLDVVILAAGAALVLPLLAATLQGLGALPRVLDADLVGAALTSAAIAFVSATLACAMATALAGAARAARARRRGRLAAAYDVLPALVLAIPPFALTAGLFLLLRGRVGPTEAGFVLLPLVNAIGALPFAYRFVAPALATSAERYGRLAALLGLSGLRRLAIVDWPMLRRPLAGAFAFSAALSFGDFGIVALFGGGTLRTVPYLLYERLGAYRLDEAAAIGLLLVAAAFALSAFATRMARC
ncbi:MAG: thiamine/thiamine pyrophosphate ABC transporter permease ThiP [Salinarimonas sp.]